MWKNHKKSYERLDWEIELYRPIIKKDIKDHTHLIDLSDLEHDDVQRAIEVYDLDDQGIGDRSSRPMPEGSNSNPQHADATTVPTNVIREYNNFVEFWDKDKKYLFFTVIIPPKTAMTVNRKTKEYGTFSYKDQIRYHRTKLNKFFDACNINNYILVYERTANDVIHSHIVFELLPRENIDCNYDYIVRMADILSFNKINQIGINLRIRECSSHILKYMCKIEVSI